DVRPVTLVDRPVILDGARSLPALFSPNGDGVLDVTSIDIVVRRSATLRISVLSDAGDILTVLVPGQSAAPGTTHVSWDGHIDGAAVADGEYRILVEAQDQEFPQNT